MVLKKGNACENNSENIVKIMATITILLYYWRFFNNIKLLKFRMVSLSLCLGETEATWVQTKAEIVGEGSVNNILGSELNSVRMIAQAFECGKSNMTRGDSR